MPQCPLRERTKPFIFPIRSTRNDGFQKYLIARLDEGNQVRVLRYIYSEQLTVPMSGGGASSAEASARWKG